MDPLSIVASCLTVVGAGGTAIKGLKKLRDLTKLPELLLSLINEVADLTLVLKDIRLNFRQDSSHVSQAAIVVIEQLLDRAQATILELDQIINYRLLRTPKDNGEITFSRSAWVFEERRVQQLQVSLRTIRLDIAARFAALNFSRILHLEIRLQDFTLMIQNLLDSNLSEPHTIRASQQAMHEQLLASLHRLHETQDQTQVTLRSLAHTVNHHRQTQTQNLNGHPDSQAATQRTTPDVLSPQPPSSSSAILSMVVQQVERSTCQRSPLCQCYVQRQWKSHPALRQIVGSLFVGYSTTPQIVPKCDSPSCHGHRRILATVSYVFPQWFLQCVILTGLSYAKRDGSGITLRVMRMRSPSDKVWTHVQSGDLETVRLAFRNGAASPFDVGKIGVSILEYSIIFKHLEISQFLLAEGADPKFSMYSRRSPATVAWNRILANDGGAKALSTYRRLFSDTIDLDERGFSLLHQIILCLDGKDLQTYLQTCSPAEVDQRDNWGQTALHWAIRRGDLVNVHLLLRHGANPNIASKSGHNSLHNATQNGNVGIIDLLLSYGVEVNHCNEAMVTPLMGSCSFGKSHPDNPACVQRVIDRGALVDAQDFQGATALMWTCQHDSILNLPCLIKNGASINLQSLSGETALTIAIESNSHRVIPVLIAHGADLALKTPSGQSLLHEAAEFGDEETLAVLTSARIRGIDINHKTKDGATAWDLVRKRDNISPEWRAAFANLVASVNQPILESSHGSAGTPSRSSENLGRPVSVPRIRLSDLVRVVEDSLYRRVVQAGGYLNAISQLLFPSVSFVLVVCLAAAWYLLSKV